MNLVVSDHYGGLVRAVRQHFQSIMWQRCQTHFVRKILDTAPKALKDETIGLVRSILDVPDQETVRLLKLQTI